MNILGLKLVHLAFWLALVAAKPIDFTQSTPHIVGQFIGTLLIPFILCTIGMRRLFPPAVAPAEES